MTDAPPAPTTDARRGTLAIFGAKLWFMVGGYALYIVLGRLLTTEQFGIWGVVNGVISLLNMIVIQGAMQTVSRFCATDPAGAADIRRQAFAFQGGFAALAIGAFLLASGALAGLLNDATLAPYFRAATAITACYALYAVNMGYLNGLRRFERQALLDVTMQTGKVCLMLLLAWLGFGIWGVIAGFAGAAFINLLLSFPVAGFRFRGAGAVVRPLAFFRFAGSMIGVAALLNAMLNLDLFMLKRLADPAVADTWAGWYTAAQSLSRIPYALMITASLVLFPTIAALSADDDTTRARRAETAGRALVLVLGVLAGISAIGSPLAERLLLVLYPERYLPGAPVLAWLVVGLSLVAAVHVCCNMIAGAGRPLWAVALLVVMIGLQGGGATILVPELGVRGAAMATTGAAATGLLLTLAVLVAWFRPKVPLRALLGVPVAAAATALLAHGAAATWPEAGKLHTVALAGGLFVAHLALLAPTGAYHGLLRRGR